MVCMLMFGIIRFSFSELIFITRPFSLAFMVFLLINNKEVRITNKSMIRLLISSGRKSILILLSGTRCRITMLIIRRRFYDLDPDLRFTLLFCNRFFYGLINRRR